MLYYRPKEVQLNYRIKMLLKICLGLALIAFVCGNPAKYSEPYKREIFLSEDIVPVDDDCGDPGYIPFFSVTWFAHVILVEWRAPANASCTGGFLVNLNDNVTMIPYDSSTDIYSNLYDNLEGCTQHTTGVRPIGLNGTAGIYSQSLTVTTLSPFFPGRIGNISYAFSNESWVVSWEPPYLEGNCIDFYDLYIWDMDYENSINVLVTNTSFEVTPYIPCKSYGLRIIPFLGILGGNQVSDLVALPARALAPPTPVEVIVGPVTNIIFELEPYASNTCEVRYLTISCTMSDDTVFGFSQLYVDSRSRPNAEIGIVDLPSNITYGCQASVTIAPGIPSEFGETIIFTIE